MANSRSSGDFSVLGGLQQRSFVAHAGVRLEDGALHRHIVGGGVDLREDLGVVVGLAPLVHVADGLQLQVGVAAAARDLLDQRLRLGRVALRQHEQRVALHLGRGGALELPFQQRDGALRVALHEPVDGHQLQLFIALRFRRNILPRGLLQFQFQRLGVIQPAAAGVGLAQFGDGGGGFVAAPEFAERVSLPVEGAIHPRAVARDHLAEALHGLVPVAIVQRALAGRIEADRRSCRE
jgi:hypothetical protein